MIRLIYNNKSFRILNELQTIQSINEVTFNDITIDFTSYSTEDIPLKYQEIQIKQCKDNENILTEGKVLFFGYVDTVQAGKMQMSDENRELNITLLSPRKLATVRCTTITGTYTMEKAIKKIFEPLINEGFVISEINVPNSQILLNYILTPIETIMNDIGQKKNIFWFIDENKNIYINSIDYLFGQNASKKIDKVEEGMLKIEPSITTTDYANVINIKNARLIYTDITTVNGSIVTEFGGFPVLTLPKIIKSGDTIEFNFPVSISREIGKQVFEEKGEEFYEPIILLQLVATGLSDPLLITYNMITDNVQISFGNNTVTYSDSEGTEGTIVLQRDSFFSDLITGFKYNGVSNITITSVTSETALRFITMKFMYSDEIEKLKGVISNTGQVEKTIDVNESWFTLPELTNYARNLIVENTNQIDTVVLEYDCNTRLKIGDLVEINLPQFYTEGFFAVTSIQYTYQNKIEQNWSITLKNSNIIKSYIDLFRPSQVQETETQEDSLVISEFIEETISETHRVEEVQNEN